MLIQVLIQKAVEPGNLSISSISSISRVLVILLLILRPVKRLLDSLILYDKKGERLNYPEGRSIILQNLSTREKTNMISKLPKKATYIKACFRQFWKLKLAPKIDTTAGIGTESPWHGHRAQISLTNQQRHYSFVPKLKERFLFTLAPAPLPPEMASKAPRAFFGYIWAMPAGFIVSVAPTCES
jgi:hypothetical protein